MYGASKSSAKKCAVNEKETERVYDTKQQLIRYEYDKINVSNVMIVVCVFSSFSQQKMIIRLALRVCSICVYIYICVGRGTH